MSAIIVAAVLILAAVAQVTVAPLFPLSAAVPDFPLLALTFVAIVRRPNSAMVALPVLAVLLAFVTDRAAGLLLIAYLPLLPLAAYLESVALPINRYVQITAALLATGLWARLLLAFAAIANGAEPEVVYLVTSILIPGLLLDWGLFTLLYLPSRIFGWSPKFVTLQRAGW